SATGVNVNVPSAATAGWLRNNDGTSLETMKLTTWLLSFSGPGEMPVAHLVKTTAPLSSGTVTSAPLLKMGGSFTALTRTVKLRLVDCPIESITVTVTIEVPN